MSICFVVRVYASIIGIIDSHERTRAPSSSRSHTQLEPGADRISRGEKIAQSTSNRCHMGPRRRKKIFSSSYLCSCEAKSGGRISIELAPICGFRAIHINRLKKCRVNHLYSNKENRLLATTTKNEWHPMLNRGCGLDAD